MTRLLHVVGVFEAGAHPGDGHMGPHPEGGIALGRTVDVDEAPGALVVLGIHEGLGLALIAGRKGKPARGWVLAAAILLLIVFLIPHSLLGSELDYSEAPGPQPAALSPEQFVGGDNPILA